MDNYFRILAIDYGKRRIGLAITDLMRIVVNTLDHIENNNLEITLNKINNLIISENVKKIVLGCPIENEKNREIVEEIKVFAEKIKEKSNLEVFIVDESYSSKKAVEKMLEVGKKKKFRAKKGNIDSFAAAIILEEFLQNEI